MRRDPPRKQSKVADAIDEFLRAEEEQKRFHAEMKELLAALVGAPDKKDDTK